VGWGGVGGPAGRQRMRKGGRAALSCSPPIIRHEADKPLSLVNPRPFSHAQNTCLQGGPLCPAEWSGTKRERAERERAERERPCMREAYQAALCPPTEWGSATCTLGQDNTRRAPRIQMHRHRPRHGNMACHETSAAFKAGTSACEPPRIRCDAHAEFAVEPRSQRVGFDCFVTKQVHPQSGVSQRTKSAMKPAVRPLSQQLALREKGPS
jgi:hypothetical protein